ncbi:MAG: hypothetical protein LBE83_05160 [Propionibacteriaceae bacterium]|jgi:hypothetical protein|nr:hypothetical protein [Propionibacteriaceae bacterium]
MEEHRCANCPIRAKYDEAPKSLTGRFWRWHIRFCPGWKKYVASLGEDELAPLKEKYNLP